MDVVRLDDNFVPDKLVEGYSDLIWTERYDVCGEFEMKTTNIEEMRAMIPEGTLLGERHSQEVMVVESYSIEPDSEKGMEATIKGRTFESFFENRTTVVVNPTAGRTAMWTYGADSVYPTDAAKALIMSHLTVSTEAPYQKVDGVAVENLVTSHNVEPLSYKHDPAMLDEEVLNLLKMENAGIRNQLNTDGALKIYIYKGVNRTVNQTDRDPLIFQISADHIVDPKYLLTLRNYKNVAYVVGKYWQQRVYAPGVSDTVQGLDRRIILVNADDIDDDFPEDKKARMAKAKGLAELAKHNQRKFFDGQASPTTPYVRGKHYNLGDRVTLMADYGVAQTMIVNEYVRVEDEEGERAYPTLIVPPWEDEAIA